MPQQDPVFNLPANSDLQATFDENGRPITLTWGAAGVNAINWIHVNRIEQQP